MSNTISVLILAVLLALSLIDYFLVFTKFLHMDETSKRKIENQNRLLFSGACLGIIGAISLLSETSNGKNISPLAVLLAIGVYWLNSIIKKISSKKP